jgi:hypothetical protein
VLITPHFPSWPEDEGQRIGLSQHIHLTAFDSPFFLKAIKNVVLAHGVFRRSIPTDVTEWSSKIADGHYPSFSVANRFFTHKWKAPDAEGDSSAPDISIDPDRIMSNIMDEQKLLHLDNNKVDYFKITKGLVLDEEE